MIDDDDELDTGEPAPTGRAFICYLGERPPLRKVLRHYDGPYRRGVKVGDWVKRRRRCRCTEDPHDAIEWRRTVGDFELLVEDDEVEGLAWMIILGGETLIISADTFGGRGTRTWQVDKAKATCEDEARRMGLAVPERTTPVLTVEEGGAP